VRPGVWFARFCLGDAWKWLGRRRKLLAQCRRNMAGLLMGWAETQPSPLQVWAASLHSVARTWPAELTALLWRGQATMTAIQVRRDQLPGHVNEHLHKFSQGSAQVDGPISSSCTPMKTHSKQLISLKLD